MGEYQEFQTPAWHDDPPKPETDDRGQQQKLAAVPSLASAGGSEMRRAALDSYLAQRETLTARLIELQRNFPAEYGEKLRDLKNEIDRIDKIILGLVASPNQQVGRIIQPNP